VHSQEGIELLANNCVVITLWEVADVGGKAKKKAKSKEAEEKPLGTITVPLTAIVFDGEQEMSGSFAVELATPDEGGDTAVPPTCEIRVALSRPLMSEQQLSEGNLMTVTAIGAYSLPEQFTPAAANISFGLNIPLPIGATGRTFTGGVAIAADEPHQRPVNFHRPPFPSTPNLFGWGRRPRGEAALSSQGLLQGRACVLWVRDGDV
jgi:hypothetical protein